MADCDDSAFIADEIIFQPYKCVKVQVVGRFVQDEYIRIFQQKLGKVKSCAFATGKDFYHFCVFLFLKTHTTQHLLDKKIGVIPVF